MIASKEGVTASYRGWERLGDISRLECEEARLKSLSNEVSDYYTHKSCCIFPSLPPDKYLRLKTQTIAGIRGGTGGLCIGGVVGMIVLLPVIPPQKEKGSLLATLIGSVIGTAIGIGAWEGKSYTCTQQMDG